MAKPLQSLCLEHLRVLSIEYVQFLLVCGASLLLLIFGLSLTDIPLFVLVWPQCRNIVDHSDSSRSIYASRCAFIPDAQMVFLELIEVFEFTFELSRDKQVFCFLVNSEHVVILIPEVFELDLV